MRVTLEVCGYALCLQYEKASTAWYPGSQSWQTFETVERWSTMATATSSQPGTAARWVHRWDGAIDHRISPSTIAQEALDLPLLTFAWRRDEQKPHQSHVFPCGTSVAQQYFYDNKLKPKSSFVMIKIPVLDVWNRRFGYNDTYIIPKPILSAKPDCDFPVYLLAKAY